LPKIEITDYALPKIEITDYALSKNGNTLIMHFLEWK